MADRRGAAALALAGAVFALGVALTAQYGFGLAPCEMCHWQRWPYFAALPLALAALVRPSAWLVGGLVALFAADALLGIFHAGVEWQLWEGLTSCSGSGLGAASVDDLKAQILGAPLVRCDEPALVTLGLSMAGWNAVLAALLAAATAWLGFHRRAA